MSDPAADFRLYHSNSLDVLAALLARHVRAPVPGQSLLEPEVILIPQVAMRRWLHSTLAAEFGVAANLEFLTPGEFVARALNANVEGEADDLDAAGMRWRLYQALRDPALLEQPPLRALRAYLSGPDPLLPWALAGELASVFEKYQAWRRDWLLRWEAGPTRAIRRQSCGAPWPRAVRTVRAASRPTWIASKAQAGRCRRGCRDACRHSPR